MQKLLIGCSVLMMTVAAAPASAAPEMNAAAAAVANGAASNGAAANGAQANSAPAAQTQSVEKKVCRQLPSSYSRMTKRVCLTAKEWEQAEREAR